MPIKPFRDHPKVPIGSYVDRGTPTSGSYVSVPPQFKQGVSVSNMEIYGWKLQPMVGDSNFTYRVIKTGGMHIRKERTEFGQTSFWKYPGDAHPRPPGTEIYEYPGGEQTTSPYEDMVGIFRGKDFITDPGTQIYPDVLFNTSLISTAVMDGVIEPLTVRGKMNITNSEGPFNAHDIRGDVYEQNNIGAVEEGSSPIVQHVEFKESYSPAFIDSSDVFLTIPVPGIADFGLTYIEAKDEGMNLNGTYVAFNCLSSNFEIMLYDHIESNGIYSHSSPAGYYYINNIAGASELNTVTGDAFTLGTDSIAFGGFRR